MPDPDETDPSDREWASAQTRTDNLDIIEIDAGVIPNIEAGAHNYWYNSPWVSTDTMLLLLAHIKPEDRGLVSTRGENSGEIWTFPPDYDQRVARKIAELRESWLPSLGGAKEKQ